MTRLARLLSRHPWRAVATAALLTVLGLALSGAVSSRLTNSVSDYATPSSISAQGRAEVLQATGVDIDQGYTLLVLLPAATGISQPPPAVVTAAVQLLRSRPEVMRVTDAWSAGLPQLISDDGRTAVVEAGLRSVKEETAATSLQSSIDHDPQLRGRVLLGGSTALDAQATAQSTRDLTFAETIAVPVLLVLLLLIFRGVVAALLPLIGAVVSIGLTTMLLLVTASLTDVSIYALNLVYALGIGLSIDFNLLIVSRFREELDRGVTVTAALERTLSTAGRTVIFSAATVTAALGALMIFPLAAISSMGLAGMLVTACSAANAVLVLPAVLALLGTRVDALPVWRRHHSVDGEATRGFWFRLSRLVMRRPVAVAVVTAAALLGIGSVSLGVSFTSYSARELPQSLPAVQVAERMTSDFHGLSANPLQLEVSASGTGAASAVRTYAAAVSQVPGIEAVAAPVREGAGLWGVDASMSSSSGISTAAVDTLHRVEGLPTALTVRPTGQTAFFVDEESSLRSAVPWAALTLAITTLVILFLMTGSVVLPVKALVMNALTLGATLGILVLVFQHGFLSGVLGFTSPGGIDLETPVLVGALAFGLSTDYGVFLLGRIREEWLGGLVTREAIAVGLQRVGRVVTAAAALFCIAVGALALSTTVVLKEIGLGAAVAVLIDASIVRALLVPSVMALLGRWNWYAPSWLTAFHRRLAFDPPEGAPELSEGATETATA